MYVYFQLGNVWEVVSEKAVADLFFTDKVSMGFSQKSRFEINNH